MGSLVIKDIVADTIRITQDLKERMWEPAETLQWANAAQREIVLHRPDACSVLQTHICEQRATQSIPPEGLRFLDATYNIDTGYSIIPISRKELDQVQRNWQSAANPVTEVEHFIFDERLPKQFKLFPVPVSGHQIEIAYSKAPTILVSEEDTISIDDIYGNAIVDYMLARMYQKNTQLTNAREKSNAHYQLFYQSLGVKFQADQAMSPNNPANKVD